MYLLLLVGLDVWWLSLIPKKTPRPRLRSVPADHPASVWYGFLRAVFPKTQGRQRFCYYRNYRAGGAVNLSGDFPAGESGGRFDPVIT